MSDEIGRGAVMATAMGAGMMAGQALDNMVDLIFDLG